MTPEDIAAVRGEVVDCDVYGIRGLDINPAVVFDFGANVGTFTEHARAVFPEAIVVAVEPDADNFRFLSHAHSHDSKVVLINKAIGAGDLYRSLSAKNGAMECYLSPGLGYPAARMKRDGRLELVKVQTVLPDALIAEYSPNGMSFAIKMDIEGAEASVLVHRPSIEAMKRADYIAAEIHKYALTGELTDEVNRKTDAALAEFETTHDCSMTHIIWRAKKRA